MRREGWGVGRSEGVGEGEGWGGVRGERMRVERGEG